MDLSSIRGANGRIQRHTMKTTFLIAVYIMLEFVTACSSQCWLHFVFQTPFIKLALIYQLLRIVIIFNLPRRTSVSGEQFALLLGS